MGSNQDDMRRRLITEKNIYKYQDQILLYQKEYMKLLDRSKKIHDEHKVMSKFLCIFDIRDLFSKWFSGHWNPILIDIDSITTVIGTYVLELNTIVKTFEPITSKSSKEDKDLLIYYISFCSIYNDFERLQSKILHNQWEE